MISRILSTPLLRVVYPLLPSKSLRAKPHFIDNKCDPSAGGRSLMDGTDRAYSLEFGTSIRDVWRDPLFRKAKARARGRSLLDYRKQMNLYLLLRFYLPKLSSRNVIELGTWRGGNLLFMATVLSEVDPGAKVYGLDTFAGMPETDASVDLHRRGDFSDVSMDDIKNAASKYGLNNIVLVKGDIRETLIPTCEQTSFGLAHIDLDIYDPIRYAQAELVKRLTPGGYLVYDDALVSSCSGATMAVEELIRSGKSCEQIYPHFVFRA